MSDEPTLEELIEAVRRQDRTAFATLYERTSPKLFALALRILGVRAMAEDALQETYVEVWRKAASFDAGRGSGAAWMAVICRSRSIDLLRRAKPERSTSIDEAMDQGLEDLLGLDDPRHGDEAGVETMALVQCLGTLDSRQREVILLAYYQGYSRQELAERLTTPENTIKTWLRRGLQSLRRCLSGPET